MTILITTEHPWAAADQWAPAKGIESLEPCSELAVVINRIGSKDELAW